jgi:multimeric flavodoxin WrbA
LYGGTKDDATGTSLCDTLGELLRTRGLAVDCKRLAELHIRPCVGCFGCWLKTPGQCQMRDDGVEIMRAMANCDGLILLSPVTFGGYSSVLKRALDRILMLLWPLFVRVQGEMRHPLRYPPPRSFLAVGWQRQPDAESAAVFARLAGRNARNMRTPINASLVLNGGQSPETQRRHLVELLTRLEAPV